MIYLTACFDLFSLAKAVVSNLNFSALCHWVIFMRPRLSSLSLLFLLHLYSVLTDGQLGVCGRSHVTSDSVALGLLLLLGEFMSLDVDFFSAVARIHQQHLFGL